MEGHRRFHRLWPIVPGYGALSHAPNQRRRAVSTVPASACPTGSVPGSRVPSTRVSTCVDNAVDGVGRVEEVTRWRSTTRCGRLSRSLLRAQVSEAVWFSTFQMSAPSRATGCSCASARRTAMSATGSCRATCPSCATRWRRSAHRGASSSSRSRSPNPPVTRRATIRRHRQPRPCAERSAPRLGRRAPERQRGAGDQPALHLRRLRHRRVEPLRPRRRPARGRDARPLVQPAVHLRRRRPGQDPPPPRHRALRRGELPARHRPLRLDRDVPERVRRRHPHQHHGRTSSAATATATSCSSTTSSSWRTRRASRRSSSTPSTRCTGPTSRSCISSDRLPDAIATLEDRLRSRFEWGLITDVQPPDLETRLAILRKKAEGEPIHVPDEVLEFIATHITRQHPRARGRPHPGVGLRQPQPGAAHHRSWPSSPAGRPDPPDTSSPAPITS